MGIVISFWNWIKNDPINVAIATLLVMVSLAIIKGVWELYKYLSEKETKPTSSGIHIEGSVTAGRDVTIQQIQTTPEQFDALLRKRLKEVMAELPAAEAERRKALLNELDAIKAKYDNLQKAHDEQKAKLAEAYKALDDFKRELAPEQINQAQRALALGDTSKAEALFQEALDQSTTHGAEAAFQLGVLAESRFNYLEAKEYYAKGVQLKPEVPRYLNSLGNLETNLGL